MRTFLRVLPRDSQHPGVIDVAIIREVRLEWNYGRSRYELVVITHNGHRYVAAEYEGENGYRAAEALRQLQGKLTVHSHECHLWRVDGVWVERKSYDCYASLHRDLTASPDDVEQEVPA